MRDLSFLATSLQNSVRRSPNGEVAWPIEDVRAAVAALTQSGRPVLGLDVRDYDADGGFREHAWSDFDEAGATIDPAASRDAALDALDRLDTAPYWDDRNRLWVLVTWDDSDAS